MQHPETQIPMAQPHPTPHSPNANPNGTVQKTADLTKRCACAVNSSSTLTLQHLTFPHDSSPRAISQKSDTSRFRAKPSQKASPNGSALALYCERLRSANAETTRREQGSTPRPPELNENPSLCVRENVSSHVPMPSPSSISISSCLNKKHKINRSMRICDSNSRRTVELQRK